MHRGALQLQGQQKRLGESIARLQSCFLAPYEWCCYVWRDVLLSFSAVAVFCLSHCVGEFHAVHIPAKILKCKAVAREVKFSSEDLLENLQMVQLVFMEHPATQELMPLEDWRFHFGFVIPNSHNSWQSTTVAAGEGNMVDPGMASGKVIIITRFINDDQVVREMRVRVFYD